MNTIQEMAAVTAAVLAGADVECRPNPCEPWLRVEPENFMGNFLGAEYRVIPKPAEIWLRWYLSQWRHSYRDAPGAKLFRQVMILLISCAMLCSCTDRPPPRVGDACPCGDKLIEANEQWDKYLYQGWWSTYFITCSKERKVISMYERW